MMTSEISLPGWLGRVATPARVALAAQFLRFGCVGVCGFAVDTAVVYALRGTVGLYAAGFVSYFVAASVTWGLNRVWTFRGRGGGRGVHRQWALFLLLNLPGLALNRGTYVAVIATMPLAVVHPVIAVSAGAIAGMFVNFGLMRTVVFRASGAAATPLSS
ncbi:MAG TPA: GtrA family protein [Acetobacteraceae bacterium]|jgi:putative flippase GtrA|nr:GtrA family protein [Acetobacteraceae bacterium]